MTVLEAFDEFIAEQEFRGNTPKTLAYYEGSKRSFLRFIDGNTPIEEVNKQTIREYHKFLAARKLSSSSVQTYLRSLRTMFTWCYNEELIESSSAADYKLPKAKRKVPDVLTKEEINTLFDSFNCRDLTQLRNYCICALMLDSGLRMNEVITLKLSAIKLSEGYAIVDGKGNKQRQIPIGMNTRKMLRRYIARRPWAETEYCFLKSDYTPITQSTVKQLFRKLKRKTNIERLHPHLLRHTFATNYLANGGDIFSLQQILGHTSLEMVRRYVHFTHEKYVPNFSNYSPLDKLRKM